MIAPVQTKHVHAIAAALLLFALPISSAFGSGFFAWTMYSGSGEYAMEIHVQDMAGRWRSVSPTGLAEASSAATADVLVGADHFRRGSSLAVLRAHLGDLAAFACRERHGLAATVVLRERANATSPERTTTAHVTCN